MLIEKLKVSKDILSGKVILITGAGGGIGFEAARALAYLGADIIIAEINESKGVYAQNTINRELACERVTFFSIDLADEKEIENLYHIIKNKYGFLDALINNATITPMGAVDAVSIADWDKSYAVNLRAPVLLTQKFLPDMKERNCGVIVFVPSSGAAPYMGAYEVFKTSQVELCNTLSAELEGTNIVTYSIGPGLVKTETAQNAIERVAALMGMDLAEFYALNEKHILDAETAGVGFAVSVVNAEKYNGQEIGSIQALMDAGMFSEKNSEENQNEVQNKVANKVKNEAKIEAQNKVQNVVDQYERDAIGEDAEAVSDLSLINKEKLVSDLKNIVSVFNEQYSGWLQRNIFERQWVLRDFKKTVGTAADSFQKLMITILSLAENNRFDKLTEYKSYLVDLKKYYAHQHKLLQSYEKNPEMLNKNSKIILNWINDLQSVIDNL